MKKYLLLVVSVLGLLSSCINPDKDSKGYIIKKIGVIPEDSARVYMIYDSSNANQSAQFVVISKDGKSVATGGYDH